MRAEVKSKGRLARWERATGEWRVCEDAVLTEHWLTKRPNVNVEELFYEGCRALAEGAMGQTVTVGLFFDRAREDSVDFRAMLCGVFRASVYGRLSVMIRGCATRADLARVRREIVGAFCDLERDGREFNGYIERGLWIESPLLLLFDQIAEGMDFICIDVDAWGIEWSKRAMELWCLTSIARSKSLE